MNEAEEGRLVSASSANKRDYFHSEADSESRIEYNLENTGGLEVDEDENGNDADAGAQHRR